MEIKLFDCFKDLEDPRRLTHILHPACDIIYIAFAVILCGMRAWEHFEDFGNERIGFFAKRPTRTGWWSPSSSSNGRRARTSRRTKSWPSRNC